MILKGTILVFTLLTCGFVFGEDDPVTVTINPETQQWIDRTDPVELQLSRPLKPEEKLAVLVGPSDLTALFDLSGTKFRYNPETIPLPTGEKELVVYVVGAGNDWREISRFPLKVRRTGGFEKVTFTPRLDLNNKGQLSEHHEPDSNAPPRDTYQDLTGQGNVLLELVRNGYNVQSQWNIIGVSYQNEALRFGEKGANAPNIDLSSFLVRVERSGSSLSFGHVSFGSNRHLVNGFGSRGLNGMVKFSPRADVSFAAMNGTSVVGWDNITGLQRREHKIYSGTLGFELIPARPGGLRFEATILDGSLLPLNNFNQGFINDAEESRGAGLRVLMSNASQRFRFEGGYTQSRFLNPEDPTLSQGISLVPVREETKGAQYLDVSFGLLQNKQIGTNRFANLSLAFRHEMVEPLFRSVAAFASADRMNNVLEVQGNIADVAVQISHNRSEDNLDDITSILKTLTRNNSVNVAVPLVAIFGKKEAPSPFYPNFTYSFNRVHQFGDELPLNSDFNASHVPDQVSDNHSTGLDWQHSKWRVGYRFGYSSQDNRQTGRENADLNNLINGINFGITPSPRWSASVDVNFERAHNKERDRRDFVRRYGLNLSWLPTDKITLGAIFNTGRGYDHRDLVNNRNQGINLEGSYRFNLVKRSQAQLFLRYASTLFDSEDREFNIFNRTEGWTINSGLSLSFL